MLSGIVSNRCYRGVNSWSPLCNFHVLSLEIATNHQQRGMKGWRREINPQTKIMMEAIKNVFCCLLKVWIIYSQLFVKGIIDNSGRELCVCSVPYAEDVTLTRHMKTRCLLETEVNLCHSEVLWPSFFDHNSFILLLICWPHRCKGKSSRPFV